MERIWVVEYDMGGGAVGLATPDDIRPTAFINQEHAEEYADMRGKVYPSTKYRAVPYIREAVSEEPRG